MCFTHKLSFLVIHTPITKCFGHSLDFYGRILLATSGNFDDNSFIEMRIYSFDSVGRLAVKVNR